MRACVAGHAARTIDTPRQRLASATTCSAVLRLDAWLSPTTANVAAASAGHRAERAHRERARVAAVVAVGVERHLRAVRRRLDGTAQRRGSRSAAADRARPRRSTARSRRGPRAPATSPASGMRSLQPERRTSAGSLQELCAHHEYAADLEARGDRQERRLHDPGARPREHGGQRPRRPCRAVGPQRRVAQRRVALAHGHADAPAGDRRLAVGEDDAERAVRRGVEVRRLPRPGRRDAQRHADVALHEDRLAQVERALRVARVALRLGRGTTGDARGALASASAPAHAGTTRRWRPPIGGSADGGSTDRIAAH